MDIFPAVPGTILELGKTGTNETRAWRFDVRKWMHDFPDGVVHVLHKRPTDTEAYPVSMTVSAENYVDWVVTSTDVAYDGYGELEVDLLDTDDHVAKSITYCTHTTKALASTDTTPPDPEQGWVDSVLAAGTAAGTNALKSEGYAVGKQNGTNVSSGSTYYHNNSKYYSEQAGSAKTAAETAQGKAEDAQTAAETAQGKAEDAQEAAEGAQEAAETAQGKAEDAQEAAETAQGKAEDAQTAAETAQGAAEDAQEAAETAQEAAEDAQDAAEDAQDAAEASALVAEGYAAGTQNGEAVSSGTYYHNNAKYYSDEAASAAAAAAAALIDDTAGDGDTDKVWSANKVHDELAGKMGNPSNSGSEGQVLTKGSSGYSWGDQVDPTSIIDDTAGNGDTGKVWSADKVYDTFAQVFGNEAGQYSSSSTYSVGALCLYNNTLYRCKTAITTAEAFNSSHWDQVRLADLIASVINNLAAKYNPASTYKKGDYCIYDSRLYQAAQDIDTAEAWTSGHWYLCYGISDLRYDRNMMVASVYNSAYTYSVGAYCLYGDVLYRCTTAISTAENWNPSHWTQVKLTDVLKSLTTGKLDTSAIDDTAGDGDTNKVWSADKSHSLMSAINVLEPTAGSGDVGKFLKAKTVADGKVTEYEFGSASGGGGGAEIDDTAGAGDTDKCWSADKLTSEFSDVDEDIDGAYSHQYSVVVNGWSDSAVTYSNTGFINSSGTVTANGSFRYSNNIPCAEGDLIYYNLYGYKSQVYIVTFYNSSGTRLSGIVGESAYKQGTVVAPENTAYVIFSTSNSYAGEFTKSVLVKVSGDNLKTELLGYTDTKTSATDTGVTLTRADVPIIEGSYYTNLGIYTQTAGRRTDYIPASEGDVVTYRCNTYIGTSVKVYTVAAFDENKNLIDHAKAESTGVFSGTYTAPANTAYLMVSWDWAMQHDGWFSITLASYTQSLEALVRSNKRVPYSPLNGKQWCCLGDSITYGANTSKTYFNYIEDRCACTPWNFGESNTAIAKNNSSVTNNMATRYVDMYNDADYITVFGGTNDHGQNIQIGQWGDADQLTLYGAMKILCDGLVTRYPNKKIGFILPLPKRTQSGGVYTDYSYPNASFYPYIQCIEDVCKRYSIPYLDLYTGSGITIGNSDVRDALMSDGIHPKAEGHEFISRKIQAFLESL